MSAFTVRVELHGVGQDSEKYTQLHEAMRKQGFSRRIKLGNTVYDLPTAEYSKIDDSTIATVLQAAKAAALTVMRNENTFSVLVTLSEVARAQHNLEVHKA